MVYMSSSPCVGWAWRPSPALNTCTCGATCWAIKYGAPDSLCRTTKRSAAIADRLAIVSSRDSPLAADERAMSRLITSADRRVAAISNVVRVRVEFSKKRLKTLLPRRSGTFFTSRSLTLTKVDAVSRMCVTMSRGRPSTDSRWTSSPFLFSCGLRLCSMSFFFLSALFDLERELAVGAACERERLLGRQAHARRRVFGLHRQFAPTAIDEHRELHTRRPAVVEEFVEHGADRAAGVEHIVEQDDVRAVHVEVDLRLRARARHAALREVVAMHRRRDRGGIAGQLQVLLQPLGEPRAAGLHADELRPA